MFNRFLYKSYRFFYLWDTWWRRRFTPNGIFILTVIVISAILGVDTTRNMIYQIFSFSAAILLLSIAWSLFFRADIRIKRELPRFVTAGEPFRYRIKVNNDSKKFQKELSLFENPKDPRPDFDTFIAAREPGEESRNAWDRRTYYYRWLWLIRQNQKAWFDENCIPDILPENEVFMDVELTPGNRGYIHFSGVIITRPDPFRLFRSFKRIHQRDHLLVLPKRYPIPEIRLSGSRKYHSGGISMASAIGNADEFVSLRDFRPGDPLKNIHWKSWAKTGDMIVREFQDEYYTRHALILDTYDDLPYSSVFEAAVSVASSFAGNLKTSESILDLMFVGSRPYTFSSGRGLSTAERLLEILACVCNERDNNITHILPSLKKHLPMLSGSICIFLKWDDNRKAVYDLLRLYGAPVLAMVITDNKENSMTQLEEYADSIHLIGTDTIAEDLKRL